MSYEEKLRERQNRFSRRLGEELGKGSVGDSIDRVATELQLDPEQARDWLRVFLSQPVDWKAGDPYSARLLKAVGRLFLYGPTITEASLLTPKPSSGIDAAVAHIHKYPTSARELIVFARLAAILFGLKSWPEWLTSGIFDEPTWAYPTVQWDDVWPDFTTPLVGYPDVGGLRLPLHPDSVFRDALQLLSSLEPHEWWTTSVAEQWRSDPSGGIALTKWARAYVAGERDVRSVDMLVADDFFRGFDVPPDLPRWVQPKLRKELLRLRGEYEAYQRGRVELKEDDPSVRYWLSVAGSKMRALITHDERIVGESIEQGFPDPPDLEVSLELSVPPLVRDHRLTFTVRGTDKKITL